MRRRSQESFCENLKTLSTISTDNIIHTDRKFLIRNIKEIIPYDKVHN